MDVRIDDLQLLYNGKGVDKQTYQRALPVLLRWLPLVTNEDIKATLADALGEKLASPAALRPLIEEFKSWNGRANYVKYSIAESLGRIANDSILDDIVSLIRDRRHGTDRIGLAKALGRMKSPLAEEVLIEMLNDPELGSFVVSVVKKRGIERAWPSVVPFLEHPKAWVRKEAKATLAKFGHPVNETAVDSHLVTPPVRIPKSLREWSTSLDARGLTLLMRGIGGLVQSGFGDAEVNEIVRGIENMEHDEDRTYRFSIVVDGLVSDLWVHLFEDDSDSYDVHLFASATFVSKCASLQTDVHLSGE